jgi:hypothetical protein
MQFTFAGASLAIQKGEEKSILVVARDIKQKTGAKPRFLLPL